MDIKHSALYYDTIELLGASSDYSYAADDTEQNVIMTLCTDEVLKGSAVDPLRKELGFVFGAYPYETSTTNVEAGVQLLASRGKVATERAPLRDLKVAKMSTNSPYIQSIEIMPSRIAPINSAAIVPNFKIPVRLYANEATTSNDALWRIIFTGGSYGEQEFPSLIDTDRVFSDYSFTYANSYTSLYAQSVGIQHTCPNINSIRSYYNSYNLNVGDYQEWASKQESPLYIPNAYVLQTVALASKHNDDLRIGSSDDSLSTPDTIDLLDVDLGSIALSSDGPGSSYKPSMGSPIRQLSPPLQLTIALSASADNVGLFYGELHDKLLAIGDDAGNFQYNKDWYESVYTAQLRAAPFSESQKKLAAHAQKNIMFSHEYYSKWDPENEPLGKIADIFPYYNKISWPRHSETPVGIPAALAGDISAGTITSKWVVAYSLTEFSKAPMTLESAYDGLHTERDFIKESIAESGFSSRFLETLKDIHDGQFPFLRFGSKDLTVEYSGRELTPADSYATHTQRTVQKKPYRTLDLIKMLQMIYNNPDAALNDDYTFVGPADASYQTTYDDNRLYRYYDNKNLIGTLNNIYGQIRTMYDITADKYTWNMEDRPSNWEDTPEQASRVLEYVFNPNFCHTETVAYRIEKSGRSTDSSGDFPKPQVLQNYWIFNSADAPDDMEIYDTQVKYGEDYTYKVYAYAIVLGKKYMYSDFRLTKQIGQLDSGPDGAGEGAWDIAPVAPDGDPEYYCVQFYDPVSGEYADQLFNIGVADWNMQYAQSALLRPGQGWHGTLDTIDAESIYGTSKISAITYESDASSPYLNIGAASTVDVERIRGDSESSALSQRNEFATNQVDLTTQPHLADFNIMLEPCVKIVEIPLFKKKLKVLDSPANDMVAIPFQYMDASKQIGFNMRYENFNKNRSYPTSINSKDRQRSIDYQYSRDILLGQNIPESSRSPQRYIEIYRTDVRPTSFADFEDKLVDTIDLRIEDSSYTYSDTFYRTQISTNKKYYYVFRFVTENLVPGHMSQVIQCELINDGSYIYSKFDVLADQLSAIEDPAPATKACKKLFQIEPNISQTALDTTGVDFQKTAEAEVENLAIGESDVDLIWDNTFKIRLTSKKTSRQIDFNITFGLKQENRLNYERADSMIHLMPISKEEYLAKVGFALGVLDPAGEQISVNRPGISDSALGELLDTLIS